ncbi:N-acetyl-anhydromuranmyl-L-alanine amidase [Bowmanella sp. JS7-9]|nr:N-acetyl-anhydromuranmyl-L-alanine amidase [Bowmanella sp. JS7-9]
MTMQIRGGWLENARQIISPFSDARPVATEISLLVVHNISLPPRQFGGPHIFELFTGQLDPQAHPYFADIYQLEVSAHGLIRRDGEFVQFVNFGQRAWHAGKSVFQGRSRCNDYSIGIELEGADDVPYTEEQYKQLILLSKCLQGSFPAITMGRIVGHEDIAPGRKTDPGVAFDWAKFRTGLTEASL